MDRSTAERLVAILDLYQEEIDGLRERYGLNDEGRGDIYSRLLIKSFKSGVYKKYSDTILRFLENRFGTQDAIAAYLGLTRTAVVKLMKKRLLEREHLIFVLDRHDQRELPRPPRLVADAWGGAEALMQGQRFLAGGTGHKDMVPEEWECCLRTTLDPEWAEAQRAGDRRAIDAIGRRIIVETHQLIDVPWRMRSAADLERLHDEWREILLVSAEDIPVEGKK